MKLLLLICLLACIPSGSLLAHPAGFSGMRLTVEAERVRVALTVHARDMDDWFPPGKYPDYVGDITREMENTVDEIVELQIQERPQAIESVRAFELETGLIEIDVDYRFADSAESVEMLIWSKHLIWLPRGHQQLLYIEDPRGMPLDTEQGVVKFS